MTRNLAAYNLFHYVEQSLVLPDVHESLYTEHIHDSINQSISQLAVRQLIEQIKYLIPQLIVISES